MKFRSLVWWWPQLYIYLRLASNCDTNEILAGSRKDAEKRNAVIEEFKTLDDDIKTVKKLKIMVEVFQRIKRENPVAYDRMVKFFDENEKAHRLRRELRLLGKKNKVEALEQKMDSSIKCHPKSGKELIQMFVRGLSELYPDMTKLLMKELEGAMDSKSVKKTTLKRVTAKVDKKMTTAKMASTKFTSDATTEATTCKKCPDPTNVSSAKAGKTTTVSPCGNCDDCDNNSSQRFSGRVCKEELNDEAGDMRIHPTPQSCKNAERLLIQTKRRSPQNENLTLTAPFKDFQVQGSIMFSNPSKPVKKLVPLTALEPPDDSIREKGIAENWRGWYKRPDTANVVSVDGNGWSNDFIDSRKVEANHVGKVAGKESSEALRAGNVPDAMLEMYPTAFQHTRNKKRSMYVLYE